MRGNKLLDKMELVDPAFVEAADTVLQKKKSGRVKWLAIAACCSIVVLTGVLTLHKNSQSSPDYVGGIARNYKDSNVMSSESAIEWPWEYKTIFEQYTSLTMEETKFHSTGRTLDMQSLGDSIGTYVLSGYDTYTDREYQMDAQIYQISGVTEQHYVAVQLENEFYVFKSNGYTPPATFGELLDNYSLATYLPFTGFTIYEGHTDMGHFTLQDDSCIWEILTNCRDAEFIADDTWSRQERNYLSFTATVDALGVYKRVFYVTSDGYIRTNIFDYGYIFYIGEEATGAIIDYATKNSTESPMEPYTNTLAGTLVEITEDYIFIDDSVLCKDPEDGMIFKVSMKDLRISRCIDYAKIGVGDTVVVSFTGNINAEAENEVEGAYSVSKGKLFDGDVLIPE